ncbi:MAG TPA: Arm DNA-binding domain-containing protein, partial [Myxococcota bacterium]|nr:Arm DNA-binding domain-containing protein [Myxococcota bacterium]
MRIKITETRIREIAAPRRGDLFVWDLGNAGFGCRIGKRRRTWLVQYRTNSHTRRMTLGAFPMIGLSEAKAKALDILARVERGEDPAEEQKKAEEERQREIDEALTVRELAARYLRDYATPKKKKSSAAGDEWLLDKYILPALGDMK